MSNQASPLISFENTAIAYQYLSDEQLKKVHFLFSVMNKPWLVKIGSQATLLGLSIKLPINGIIRNTIYNQFCGGEELDETSNVILQLAENKMDVLLNYSVEGLEDEKSFKNTYKEAIKGIEFASIYKNIRAICLKFTGYGRIALFEKIQAGQPLNIDEQKQMETAKKYIDDLCKMAHFKKVQIYVDAEESWFQDTIDQWADEMMEKYNKETAIVFNTYQLYRHDKLDYLKKSYQKATDKGYILGAKLVRGAYVEKENNYAAKNGKKSPINPNKEATDKAFNEALTFCIDHIDHISVCCATHNEKSCLLAVEMLSAKPNYPTDHFCFSQLYGMGDYISYNLSHKRYKVAKYLPYGPVKDVIPYLIRRAQENTSVEGQTSRELMLLNQEIKRRGL